MSDFKAKVGRVRSVPLGLTAAAVIVGVLALLQARPDAAARVPGVSRQATGAAAAAVRRAGFTATVTTVPGRGRAGAVLRQDPPAGSIVRRGTVVHLYVSAGAAQVQVPQLRGSVLQTAVAALAAAGLRAGDDVVYVQGSRRLVLRTEPAAGTSADRDSRVRVYVGSGG